MSNALPCRQGPPIIGHISDTANLQLGLPAPEGTIAQIAGVPVLRKASDLGVGLGGFRRLPGGSGGLE